MPEPAPTIASLILQNDLEDACRRWLSHGSHRLESLATEGDPLAVLEQRRDAFDAVLIEQGVFSPQVFEALISRGVPAHRVLDSPGLCEDPQLLARDHFVERESGGIKTVVEATRSRLSRTPARVSETVPTLGGDNEWVLSEVLGYDDEKIAQLAIAGALE